MIKKLRQKFIWIAMCSVLFVLGTIVAIINIVNYSRTNEYSDFVVEMLAENQGGFPQDFPLRPSGGTHGVTPETPFETRFFTVLLSGDGEVLATDLNRIAAVTQEEAIAYAKRAREQGAVSGMFDDYKYKMAEKDGGSLYVFLDCSREMNSFRAFLTASIVISLIGVGLVFVLVLIFSRIVLKPVEESYQKQKHFITNASHDIKTPLTIIGAETDIIELEHGASEWTKEIKNQIGRLTSLTEKLVFLSRMEEEIKPELKEFDLSETFSETLHPYEALAQSGGLALISNCQPNILYTGNEEMLRQAIALLLDNAIKYASEKGKIEATLKRTPKGVELRFRNDTDGIKQGNLDALFERFYRMDESRNSHTGGNGIGLSVVKAIVTAHKGKVTAQSADGESIEITIVL